MPLPRPRLGADVGAESLEALEWLGAVHWQVQMDTVHSNAVQALTGGTLSALNLNLTYPKQAPSGENVKRNSCKIV